MAVSTIKKSTNTNKKTELQKDDLLESISHTHTSQKLSTGENHLFKIIIIILLLLNLGATLSNMIVNNVFDNVESIEAMKVGGIENYEKLKTIMNSEAYKDNYAQNLEMMLLQIQQSNNTGSVADSDISEEIDNANVAGSLDNETTGDIIINNEGKSDE